MIRRRQEESFYDFAGSGESQFPDVRPANAVWAAARSSDLMNVLNRKEVEEWECSEYSAQLVLRDFKAAQAAFRAFGATCEYLGIQFLPGARVPVTPAGRGEFTRLLGVFIVSLQVVRGEGAANIIFDSRIGCRFACPHAEELAYSGDQR